MLSLSLLLILISLLSLINRTKQSLPITWSNRLGITLTPISTGVWGAERSFIWNNIDVGGRSVICRMNDGSLLVHSPVNYTSELGSALTALGGNVGYIVSPNFEHLKYASQWSEVFPSAKLVACPGLPTKKTKYTDGMKWDIELGHSSSWADDSIDTIFFDCESVLGQPFFNEVIFYHKKSKTCFLTDVYWNYPASDLPNYYGEEETGQIHQCSKVPVESKLLPSINVPFGTKAWKFGMDKIYWPFYKNVMVGKQGQKRDKYNKAVEKLLSWNIETLAPCHGDIIRGEKLIRSILLEHFT